MWLVVFGAVEPAASGRKIAGDRTEDALLRPALRGLAPRRIVSGEAGT